MRKYKLISALAEETAKEVVRNEESWRRYLNTASGLYKYPFKEQLLIYAQRPDATACASIEIWNEKMHCWVNKGAKGIALIDEDSFSGLKYVFDITDEPKAIEVIAELIDKLPDIEVRGSLEKWQAAILASHIDQFSYDYHTYQYQDTVEDSEAHVRSLTEDIRH